MRGFEFLFLFVLFHRVFCTSIRPQSTQICVTSGFEKQCDQLERESPEIQCVRVRDIIECVKILRKGSPGFGIFSAESMLLLAALEYDGLNVLKELRHQDRRGETSDMDSVVIVRATHSGGRMGLKGLKYCHPGFRYGHAERWTERFSKHFERTVTTPDCESASNSSSPTEIEVSAVADFFGPSCRPGAWSNNPEEDKRLKGKYPELCELCTSKGTPCDYSGTNHHTEALRCLTDKGQVAYVSLQHARDFFTAPENAGLRSQFAYLCPDNTLQIMNDNPTVTPCTWLSQPWPAIVASVYNNIELSNNLNKWVHSTYGWENAIREILTADSRIPFTTTIQEPRSVFRPYREVPFSFPLCSTSVTWCTKSFEEKEKCQVIRMAGITTGVYPQIECQEPVGGATGCMREVSEGRADFTVIESNYGYIARSVFNLTTALYAETEGPTSAGVVVRVNSTFQSFEDLRGARACFPEFNGIASIAFLNVGKKLGFLQKSRNHSIVLNDFIGPSCAPGATDQAHDVGEIKDNLCSLCPQTSTSWVSAVPSVPLATMGPPLDRQPNTPGNSLQNELDVLNSKLNCNADQYNSFFGDRGALSCLLNNGEVAILGLQNLKEHARSLTIDPSFYQIICRNGSRANQPGFDVDPECALATFIESEVVVKPGNPKLDGIINALLSFDEYFKSDPNIDLYGSSDTIFKNGTIGLAAFNEDNLDASVESYRNLLAEAQACGGAHRIQLSVLMAAAVLIFSIIVNRSLQ